MVRKLPTDPEKRRLQVLKRIYQNLPHFYALMEDGRMEPPGVVTLETGEDVYLPDLMVGIDSLPPRQRQAFVLICLQGYTETAARDELLPNSKSSTPVQQYADSGLARMVNAYDAKQAGNWPPPEQPKPIRRKIQRRSIVTTIHPLVRAGLENTRKEIVAQLDGLKSALAQIDGMLGGKSQPSHPAPTPRPEGKPVLEDMAKSLAQEELIHAS